MNSFFGLALDALISVTFGIADGQEGGRRLSAHSEATLNERQRRDRVVCLCVRRTALEPHTPLTVSFLVSSSITTLLAFVDKQEWESLVFCRSSNPFKLRSIFRNALVKHWQSMPTSGCIEEYILVLQSWLLERKPISELRKVACVCRANPCSDMLTMLCTECVSCDITKCNRISSLMGDHYQLRREPRSSGSNGEMRIWRREMHWLGRGSTATLATTT